MSISEQERKRIRDLHEPWFPPDGSGECCMYEGDPWPCIPIRLLDALEDKEKEAV